MNNPERLPERDTAIDVLVATVPFPGWTLLALRESVDPDADLLFPIGPTDMVEAYSDLADRRMAEGPPLTGKLPAKVHAVIARRFAQNRLAKQAIRRGLAVLAPHPLIAAAVTARTVDAIWHAAGDRSADFSWYTKRAILAAVYSKTLLFWLGDDSDDDAKTLAFLDRRLADVGQIGKLRRRASGLIQRVRPSRAA